jgi:hypothetical protein
MSDHVPYVPAERSARERDIAVLAERPTDPAGLVALTAALADRLARTGGPAEVAASAWLADQLAARSSASPSARRRATGTGIGAPGAKDPCSAAR